MELKNSWTVILLTIDRSKGQCKASLHVTATTHEIFSIGFKTIFNWSAFNNEVCCPGNSTLRFLELSQYTVWSPTEPYSRHYLIDYITYHRCIAMSCHTWTTIDTWSCYTIHHLSCDTSSTIDTYIYISCLLSSFIVLQWGDILLQITSTTSTPCRVSFPIWGAQQVKCWHLPGRRWWEWVRASLVITWSSYRAP
jgi:hypothetical protein